MILLFCASQRGRKMSKFAARSAVKRAARSVSGQRPRFRKSTMHSATINPMSQLAKWMFRLATECTPPKVQFVPHIPMLKENNVRTGFVETEARMRLEQACSTIGRWMLAMFEVGCTSQESASL